MEQLNLFSEFESPKLINKIEEALTVITKEMKMTDKIEKSFDGRLDSAHLEGVVLLCVEDICKNHNYRYKKAKARDFCDFYLYDEPVNIKISEFKNPDNVCGLAGIAYAFTGKESKNKDEAFKLLEDFNANGKKNNRVCDYYFLIVHKEKKPSSDIYLMRDAFFTSVKQLENIAPNPSNPPFQCNWGKNRNRIRRTEDEARKFIFPGISKSLENDINKKKEIKKVIDECGR